MLREYLDEILSGEKTYDARAYDTAKRGTIALVDTKKSLVIGLVDIIGTHRISAEEYRRWHATGKWADCIFQVENPDAVFYAYDFENPHRLAQPVKIEKNGRTWVTIDESVQSQFYFQPSMFD